jgi:glutamate--cysteine ligase
MVPHLITALTGPTNELEQRVLDCTPAIERWFRLEWMEHTPPFYCSVDVRNAGFKLAPVDTNLYPSSWNHLSADMLPLAVQAAMAAIEKICPEARNLIVVPDNHNRSPSYLNNLAQLRRIFHAAGLNVRFGSISADLKEPVDYELTNGGQVTIEPLMRTKGRVGLKGFDPCTILMNNDLAAGVPGILEDLHQQYLLPPLHAGWSTRRRSFHFQNYEENAKRFSKLLGIDPWLINPLFAKCGEVNLNDGRGMDALASHVDALLAKVRRKYKEYGINEKPFVVVKADNDNMNGAAAFTVRDAKDLEMIRLRSKNRRSDVKIATEMSEVLLQEGVLTNERLNESVAEPVVYMMDRYVVGGFYRVHADRRMDENLAGPGSSFIPLAFQRSTHLPQSGVKPGASAPNRFYMYGVVARLAMLAASYELEATDPDSEIYD